MNFHATFYDHVVLYQHTNPNTLNMFTIHSYVDSTISVWLLDNKASVNDKNYKAKSLQDAYYWIQLHYNDRGEYDETQN